MVERHGGLSEMVTIQKELKKLFEQLAHFERTGTELRAGEWIPAIDVFETKGSLIVKVEAPGMTRNDRSVVFNGHKLVVSGEKKQPREEKAVNGYICLERSFGKFASSIYIVQAVAMTKATAKLSEGVLTITLPKVKDRRGAELRINIKELD